MITTLIAKALNRYLALDPASSARLQKLHDKVVVVELLKTGIVFRLVFTATGVGFSVLPGEEVASYQADTIIRGTPLRLLHMSLTKTNRQQFFADDVSIQGSVEHGQQVIDLFDHIDIDWEEQASKVMGDVPAYHLGQLGRRIKKIVNNTSSVLTDDVKEYIHEEINWFPPREALQDFFHDVDELRMDVDRLEARVSQLGSIIARQAKSE